MTISQRPENRFNDLHGDDLKRLESFRETARPDGTKVIYWDVENHQPEDLIVTPLKPVPGDVVVERRTGRIERAGEFILGATIPMNREQRRRAARTR